MTPELRAMLTVAKRPRWGEWYLYSLDPVLCAQGIQHCAFLEHQCGPSPPGELLGLDRPYFIQSEITSVISCTIIYVPLSKKKSAEEGDFTQKLGHQR